MTQFNPLFGKGNLNIDYANFFIGDSYLNFLARQDDISVNNVTFKPGARNDWHIHHNGFQILLITDGEGFYQAAGEKAKRIVKGDVISIAKGVKHWHGATKDNWMSHIAINKGISEWLEPVSDDYYHQVHEINE